MDVSSTGEVSTDGVPAIVVLVMEILNSGRGYTVLKSFNGEFWRINVKNEDYDPEKDAFYEFDIINQKWTDGHLVAPMGSE